MTAPDYIITLIGIWSKTITIKVSEKIGNHVNSHFFLKSWFLIFGMQQFSFDPAPFKNNNK